MTVYDWFQLIGGIILALGYLPQAKQIMETGSVKDLNLKAYLSIFIGIFFMEIYAVNLFMKNTAIMFCMTNSISLIMVGYIIALILAFGRKTYIKDALYATKYSDGSTIITPCKVNMHTKEVFDIVPYGYDCGCCMDGEFVLIDEEEFPSVPSTDGKPFDNNFWYEA